MPGYGILEADDGQGLLPWSWAEERLVRAHNYWVSTARPDGRPHAAAVWGVWLDDAFWFSTGVQSRKARNLAANRHCVVHPERADEAVIVEGLAAEVGELDALQRFKAAYDPKYRWEIDVDSGGIYVVRPRVVFGFIEHADAFAASATRWTFAENL
jgi:hypothetical protein